METLMSYSERYRRRRQHPIYNNSLWPKNEPSLSVNWSNSPVAVMHTATVTGEKWVRHPGRYWKCWSRIYLHFSWGITHVMNSTNAICIVEIAWKSPIFAATFCGLQIKFTFRVSVWYMELAFMLWCFWWRASRYIGSVNRINPITVKHQI